MQYLDVIKAAVLLIIPVLLFLTVYMGRKGERTEQEDYLLYLQNSRTAGRLKKRTEKLELYISRYGADVNLGINKAEQLIIMKAISVVFFFILANELIELKWAVVIGMAGWKFPDFLINLMNREDNEKIFGDMKALYDTLRIQQSAGIYITTSLMYSYKVVRCKRFKTALKQLSSDIMSEKDIVKAINVLSVKFKNEQIDEFVSMVSQSVQTGQMVEMLNQVNKQLINIEKAINKKKEDAIERKMLVIMLLLFVGIIAVVLYAALGSDLMSTGNF